MRSVLGICCAALAALASCGGSGPSTEEEVRAAAVEAIETENEKLFCRTLVSAHYLEVVYRGEVGECLESGESVADDPGEARVTRVVLDPRDETRAEVELTMRGGELDGAAGHVGMVEEEDRWKLDDFGDDYLRSALIAEIRTVDSGVAAIPQMKACYAKQVRKMDAAEVRQLTLVNNGGHEAEVRAKLLKLAENCPAALAEYTAWEITKGLAESGKRSPAFVRCIREEATGLLLLTDITPQLLKEHPGFAAVGALEGIVVGAKRNCLKRLGGG
ncbi:MAG TPA: hypothetical protein VEB65_05045 [Solirubrobacterales bacterium]|nr:hypothetical protein [Solirubrobacterales bacterium]